MFASLFRSVVSAALVSTFVSVSPTFATDDYVYYYNEECAPQARIAHWTGGGVTYEKSVAWNEWTSITQAQYDLMCFPFGHINGSGNSLTIAVEKPAEVWVKPESRPIISYFDTAPADFAIGGGKPAARERIADQRR